MTGTAPVVTSSGPGGSPLVVRLPWVWLWWLTAVGALLVALDQVSRLFAGILTNDGTAWGLTELMGPSALLARDGWRTTFGPGSLRGRLLGVYLWFDVALIVLYVLGGSAHLRRHFRRRTRRFLFGWLSVLAVVDGVEDVLASAASRQADVAAGLVTALPWVSTAKFVIGAGLVVVLLWSWRNRIQDTRSRVGARTVGGPDVAAITWRRETWFLVRQHRLSLIPVVLLGVLLVAPGTGIFDQMPDVERRWAVGSGNFWAEGGLGLVALLVLSGALFVLGRARTALACRDVVGGPTDSDGHGSLRDPEGRSDVRDLGFWLVGPVVVGLALLVRWWAGAPVSGWRYLVFCAVPVLVVVLSFLLRSHAGEWRRPTRQRWEEEQLRRLGALGDGLALAVLALGAVGAVRALIPVVVLRAIHPPLAVSEPVAGRVLTVSEPFAGRVLAAGVIGVLALWPAVGLVHRVGRRYLAARGTSVPARAWRWLTPTPGDRQPAIVRGLLPTVMLLASGVTFVLLALLPSVAARAGVLSVLVVGLTSLTGLTAGAGLLASRRPTAEVFRALRLRSTPVATLLLVAVVAAGLVDGGTVLHGVRSAPPPAAGAAPVAAYAAAARPDLTDTITTWAAGRLQAGCVRRTQVGDQEVDVLPMVLLASEGGGIRAAYWTAAVSEQLDTGCADGAVVLSSGVSGGAVGLAAARYNDHPLAAVSKISNSRALSSALSGLLVRDFAFSATGVPLPLLDRSGQTGYTDRAGLIEDAWAKDAAGGGEVDAWAHASFADPHAARSSRVGSVILNSMSVSDACRVWVSEVRLRADGDAAGPASGGGATCDTDGVSGLRSIDLLSAWSTAGPDGPPAGGGDSAGCLHGLTVITAALLAARFPYVTPSGRVGPCAHPDHSVTPTDQLVDGGYLENTGLGTLVDLSDVWLPAVQQWNAAHATPRAGGPRPLIVPVVAYLDNGSGTDRSAPRHKIAQEALLPPLAKLRADAVGDAATLQRASDVVQPDHVCGSADVVCRQAAEGLGHRTFVVFPATEPQVAAPLGWILSDASRASLDDGVAEQASTTCPTEEQLTAGSVVPAGCRRGYGSLKDLVELAGSSGG